MLIVIDVYWSSSLLKLIFEILHSMLCRCHVFPCNKQTILVQWILPPKSKTSQLQHTRLTVEQAPITLSRAPVQIKNSTAAR